MTILQSKGNVTSIFFFQTARECECMGIEMLGKDQASTSINIILELQMLKRVEICTSSWVGERNYHLTHLNTRTELYTSRYLPADLFQLKSNFITLEVKFDHHSGPADWQQQYLVVVARKRKMNIVS